MMLRPVVTVILLGLLAVGVTPALAQLATPNGTGAAMGHVHLAVKDPDTHRRLFVALGGKPVQNGTLQMIQFPGVFINLRQAESTSGGMVGSNVNHFGFHVKNVAGTLATIAPFGLTVEQNNPQQAFVSAPDGVRIELLLDDALPMPVRMHHVHMFVTSPLDVQAWYGKNFGATPGKRGQFDTASVPGVELSFTQQDAAQAPTKGRSLDHIGFEVRNLDAFLARLKTQGVTTIEGPRMAGNGTTKIAFLTDPWGTYIELTEGLSPRD